MDENMKKEMATAIERVKQMSRDLDLEYHPQDWGIVNGRAERIKEFIDYFQKGEQIFHSTQKFELFELIISSFNDAIIKEVLTDERKILLNSFLEKYSTDELYEVILNYWRRDDNEEEMPLWKYL